MQIATNKHKILHTFQQLLFDIIYAMKRKEKQKFVIVIAFPLAHQDGIDNYNGFMRYLTEHTCNWQIRVIREQAGMDDFVRLAKNEADAAIISHNLDSGNHLPIFATATHLPLAVIDPAAINPLARRRNTVFISIDSKAIARTAAQYFTRHPDYAAFGFVGEANDSTWSVERATAFRTALNRKRITLNRFQPMHCRNREVELRSWLKTLRKPAAVFADCDRTAAEILQICDQNEIRVPFEISVLGVDNELITCTHSTPMLSSIQPDFVEEGYRAAEAIDRMLSGKQCPRWIICAKHRLVERQSTGLASQARHLVIRADDLIQSEACNGLKVADLPKRLNVSRRLLDLRYRQIKGQSLLESIRAVRLEKAWQLLNDTTLSVKEIAATCHVGSAGYTRCMIRRHFGLSVRDIRR